MNLDATIAARVAELDGIEADLSALAASSGGNVAANVASWRATAAWWRELAPRAAEGGEAFTTWRTVGERLATQAGELARDVNDASLGARITAFAAGMPRALESVIETVAAGAAATVGTVAGATVRGIAGPVLLAAGVLALAAFLVTRAGVNVNAGPVRLGS